MHMVRRAVLVAELKLAHDEGMHLGEMITVLETTHAVDEGRLRQLRLERRERLFAPVCVEHPRRDIEEFIVAQLQPVGGGVDASLVEGDANLLLGLFELGIVAID